MHATDGFGTVLCLIVCAALSLWGTGWWCWWQRVWSTIAGIYLKYFGDGPKPSAEEA
jgi:hypothetical protein